jgi:hypothetical protein
MTSTMTVDQDGNKIWCNQEGQWHRTDGPAFERANGQRRRTLSPGDDITKSWYLNDQELTFAEWLDRVADTNQERTLLSLKFG